MDYTNLLVLDCKTTMWENAADKPAGQSVEIINIDLAVVDTVKNQIIEREEIFIKPKTSKISAFCEKVFGIKQSKLDICGISFQEAYRRLRIYYTSRDKIWVSWDSYEKYHLDREAKNLGLESLFAQPHYGLQDLFKIMTGTNNSISVSDAAKMIEMPLNDNVAVNIANIYLKMARGCRAPIRTKTLEQLKSVN